MLKRKVDQDFEKWYSQARKKALFVEGARQVGKTTTIRQFCTTHYKNVIEINFVKKPTAKLAFDGNLDIDTILLNLSSMGFGPFEKGNTVVFFDEIQDCPNARTAIKFLVEDGSFDYIESGSLLGINYKEEEEDDSDDGDIASLPVGSEDILKMFPLDFEEFLWACGIPDNVIDVLRDSFRKSKPVPEFIHAQIMERFRQYLVVGGLPEIVNTFVHDSDFSKTEKLQRDLIAGYRRDITKYAKKDRALVRAIFDSLPFQLAKQDKRFVMAELEKGASRRKYAEPTQWLIDAGMAYYAINVGSFTLPFSNSANRKLFKLYSLDSGVICQMSLSGRQFEVLSGTIDINEGALAEEFVAAEFAKKGYDLYYYDTKSKHELDFLLAKPDGVHIIEVKSGSDFTRHASLDYALKNEGMRIAQATVLCKGNIYSEEGVIYLPLYMTMFI